MIELACLTTIATRVGPVKQKGFNFPLVVVTKLIVFYASFQVFYKREVSVAEVIIPHLTLQAKNIITGLG